MRLKRYDVDSLENRDPDAIARVAGWVRAVLRPYFRARLRGVERVPDGAALYVGNHSGGLVTADTFLLLGALHDERGLDAVPYALAGDSAIRMPGLQQLLAPLGAVRATPANAQALLAAGRKVLVYPGGDLEAMRSFAHRDKIIFGGRTGYIRLALRTCTPVVPVVTAGAHATCLVLTDGQRLARWLRAERWLRVKTWPITVCLPWGLVIGPGLVFLPWPSRIHMEILEPLHFDRHGEEAANDPAYVRFCADLVESQMQAALTRLASERRRARWLPEDEQAPSKGDADS